MEHFTGVLDDNRPQIEKQKDWKAEEVLASSPLPLRKVTSGDWQHYQLRDQDGSGSCVANAIAKILEVKRLNAMGDSIQFSHQPIYTRRANKPGAGMYGPNAMDIAVKFSSCKESDQPSMEKNDVELDSMTLPPNYEDLNNWVKPTNYLNALVDFDTVCSYIQQEKAVLLFTSTNYQSWCKDIPKNDGKEKTFNHGIAGVDCFNLDGEDYILINDSWGKWFDIDGNVPKYAEFGERLISRKFFKDCIYYAGVMLEFKYDVSDLPEKYVFKNFMLYGQKNNDIIKLQEFLKSKGYFPSNQPATGLYGNITAKAVLKFQIDNNVASLKELTDLQGKACRSKTLLALNK